MGLGELSATPLPRSFFDRPSHEVAPDLLGRVLVHGPVAVRLTEVEAYGGPGEDPAAHTYRGRTPRNAVMFGPPGHLYVYFTYGMHFCANLVCLPEGSGSAVLLRAGEIVTGLDEARARRAPASASERRGPATGKAKVVPDRDLARGPARLAVALGLLREHNGLDAIWEGSPAALPPLAEDGADHGTEHGTEDGTGHAAWLTGLPHGFAAVLEGRPAGPGTIRSGPRTGVSTAKDTPWRFWVGDDPTVSPYRVHVPRRRSSAATSVGEAPSS
ncbi:DNA-3-methyladenine glycosylase [Nonomuraea sp. WAC 01424]|uniref:DNA-3-methyladenine glycosylase n=1 Tax=Nonomuraea sp. WAC 01424 TaxID=2203200 RepID=UPI000F7BA1E9|nr:DNA-3-methyladenine glycosylase [Nonomuraea sp. WAC 01424]RSN10671.1 DNA-3-methyladenine glycosylase [Nonomuraea sp. WAC 01424]